MKFLDRFESVLIDQIARRLADDIFSIGVPWFERDAVQRAPTSICSKITLLAALAGYRRMAINRTPRVSGKSFRQEFYKFHMGAVQASPFGRRGTP
jgi:hypothetical protein